jgi:hypothetical protein
MNTNIDDLIAARLQIRAKLARATDITDTHLESQAERQAANRGVNRGRSGIEEPDARSPLETDLLGGIAVQEVGKIRRRLQALRFDTGNFSHTNAEALVPGLPRGMMSEESVTLLDGSMGRADRVRYIYHETEGYIIGAHVYEIKPNTPDQIAKGNDQAKAYMDGFRAKIESDLRAANKPIPTTAPDGSPLYSSQVMTYDRERMRAVLRAVRASRQDFSMRTSSELMAQQLTEDEAIARQVFGGAL